MLFRFIADATNTSKAIPYSPPTAYEFPDQKSKRMKHLIHKCDITTNDSDLQL